MATDQELTTIRNFTETIASLAGTLTTDDDVSENMINEWRSRADRTTREICAVLSRRALAGLEEETHLHLLDPAVGLIEMCSAARHINRMRDLRKSAFGNCIMVRVKGHPATCDTARKLTPAEMAQLEVVE